MEYTMLIVALSVCTAVLSIVALVYTQILTKRFNELASFVGTLEKDTDHLRQAMNCYKDDRKALFCKVDELDRELETAREALAEWKEAGELARKSEKDFNEGLNNILSYQPGVSKKGDEK